MPAEQQQPLEFPTAGVDVSGEFGGQAPGTTAKAANVRSCDPLRELDRGGSRPGLSRFATLQVAGERAPVQHMAVLVTADSEALNTDYVPADSRSFPSTHPEAVVGVDYYLDPSTNNNAAGRGDRNPGRAVPQRGSGRPHINSSALAQACICRTYIVAGGFEEGYQGFSICGDDTFPLDFTLIATQGGWAFGALVAPGPAPPTVAELNALIQAAGASGEPFDDSTTADC